MWSLPKARWKRRTLYSVTFIVVLLIGIRAILPEIIQRYVNRKLDEIPEYDGRIGDVDLHLWRGAYSVDDVKIVKTTGKVPVPLFSAPTVDFSMEWQALLRGKVVGEVNLDRPILNFVNGSGKKDSQLSIDAEWLQVVKDLFPFRINRFEIDGGTVHYRDFDREPKVDVALTEVNAVGTNFSNTRSATQGMLARINATALAEKHARMNTVVQLSPGAKEPTFNLDASLRKLELARLNDFLRAYANIDAEGGTVSVDTELAAERGSFRGYVKPLIKDAEFFSLEEDSKNIFQLAWEGIVGTAAEVLENQRHDQIATRVPFSGTFDNPEAAVLPSIFGVLRNAFIEALKPGNEHRVGLGKDGKQAG